MNAKQATNVPAGRFIANLCASLWVEALIAIACLAVIYEGSQMPQSKYDIVGSARLPMTVAGGVLVLVALRFFNELRSTAVPPQAPDQAFTWPVIPVLFVASIFSYVALLAWGILPFFALTGIFTAVAVQLIAHRFTLRLTLTSLIAGLLFGGAVQIIFTKLLVLDLPT